MKHISIFKGGIIMKRFITNIIVTAISIPIGVLMTLAAIVAIDNVDWDRFKDKIGKKYIKVEVERKED